MERFKAMLIEDDERLRALMAEALERWDIEVATPDPSEDLVAALAREGAHLVILDVGLPRLDGYEWCARIRAVSRVPILFVSASSGSAAAVRGLAEGGDDWLPKPFDPALLVAKAKALLRRAYSWAAERPALLERNGLVLDVERCSASIGGESARLGRNETILLRRLLERDGAVATREELQDALWSADAFVDDNTLTVNVTRLKKSLAGIGGDSLIETVRGLGYRLP